MILANESLVVIAIFVTPHSLIPVVENETILISLRAGFVAIPIGKTETLKWRNGVGGIHKGGSYQRRDNTKLDSLLSCSYTTRCKTYLSSDPLPTAFATPVTGAKPKLVGFASGAKSLAEVLLNFVVGNSRQRSLISFTHAIGRIPKEVIRIISNVPRTQQVVIEQNSIHTYKIFTHQLSFSG